MKFIEVVKARLDSNGIKYINLPQIVVIVLEEFEKGNKSLDDIYAELRPPKPPEVRLAEIVDAWLRRDVVDSPEALSLVSEILEREKGE
jgi:hypothetical protein